MPVLINETFNQLSDRQKYDLCSLFPRCFSYIGKLPSGGQNLSIGNGCDEQHIVEHEFLHALGLYHEQSRPDRDDYLTIMFENIQTGSSKVPIEMSVYYMSV